MLKACIWHDISCLKVDACMAMLAMQYARRKSLDCIRKQKTQAFALKQVWQRLVGSETSPGRHRLNSPTSCRYAVSAYGICLCCACELPEAYAAATAKSWSCCMTAEAFPGPRTRRQAHLELVRSCSSALKRTGRACSACKLSDSGFGVQVANFVIRRPRTQRANAQ